MLLLVVQMMVKMLMELRRSGQHTVRVSNSLVHSGMVAVGQLWQTGPEVHVSTTAVFMVVAVGVHYFPARRQSGTPMPGDKMENAAGKMMW